MRTRKNTIIWGEKDAGKTSQILAMIDAFQHGKVIIYDKQNEFKYWKYPLIDKGYIPFMKSGIYRFYDPDWKDFIKMVDLHFPKKGLMILEDAGTYLDRTEFKPLTSIMGGVRHKYLDTILTFHQLSRIPPYVLANGDVFMIFKTNETIKADSELTKVPKYEQLRPHIEEVEAHPDIHHFKIVHIRGQQVQVS